jgi:hypothetical protein
MNYINSGHIPTKKYEGFGGNFFDSDMLASAYDAGKPHIFDKYMGQLFSSTDRFNGKPLIGMTMAKGKMVEIDNEIYRWKLVGAQEKFLRSVEVLDGLDAADAKPGLGRTNFRVKLDEGWYSYPDVIEGEHDDYKLEVVSGPEQDGNGYIYTLRLQTDDFSKFFPSEYLAVGREFSKVWTSVASEFNEDFGTMQFGSSFELECQVGAFAQKFTVTDKAMREDGRLGMPVPYRDEKTGKVKYSEKFIPLAEAKNENELYDGIEYAMWKGEKSTSVGTQGYIKRTGPGVRQQLRDGHIMFYNGALTESMLYDYLDAIFFSRVSEGQRKITAMTGTMGATAFHNMLATSASSFLTVDTHYIAQRGSDPRHLSYGAQFVHYKGINGIEVDLVINPLYDDTKFCKRMHPVYTNKPIDSWRMTFMDFGSDSDGNDNMTMLSVKDTRRYGYIPGTVGPMGPIKGGALHSAKAGCEFLTEGTGGIWIKDVSRGGEIILDFDY